MFELIKISQGIKTFFFIQKLIRKPFQTFFYSFKNLFEKIDTQSINFLLPKTYANSFAKEILTKGFISNKVCYDKGTFENKFQKLFFY
jgi:hypothetical protein